jgi:hypothetical protein
LNLAIRGLKDEHIGRWEVIAATNMRLYYQCPYFLAKSYHACVSASPEEYDFLGKDLRNFGKAESFGSQSIQREAMKHILKRS